MAIIIMIAIFIESQIAFSIIRVFKIHIWISQNIIK
jgi:hypothetical protein